jgi:methyl-accepting chemotaxis protein
MDLSREREKIIDAVDSVLSEAEDAYIEVEDVRDKLYDFTSAAESLSSRVANLANSGLDDILSEIREVESEADELAQSLRDYHSEL